MTTALCAGGFSVVNGIGPRTRNPINSGLIKTMAHDGTPSVKKKRNKRTPPRKRARDSAWVWRMGGRADGGLDNQISLARSISYARTGKERPVQLAPLMNLCSVSLSVFLVFFVHCGFVSFCFFSRWVLCLNFKSILVTSLVILSEESPLSFCVLIGTRGRVWKAGS